ncbi:MAG: hypothetical protein ACI8Q1_002138 [Parvicella sp.]|jgi:hypothetical protein
MTIQDKISVLSKLGKVLLHIGNEDEWTGFEWGITEDEYLSVQGVIGQAKLYNGWFEKREVLRAFTSWGKALTPENLEKWISNYEINDSSKTVGLILAGNIPLVGFHDMISVYLSGHKSLVKLSTDDSKLIPEIIKIWSLFDVDVFENIKFTLGRMENFDAIIATGSNNTARYFEQYFGSYPHIFRKNRTSVAVITGEETEEELILLGDDIFAYYGLGCRNITKLYVPFSYNLDKVFGAIFPYKNVTDNNKYGNNYDYHKAIFLMEQYDVIENGFILLKEDEGLTSPIGTLYYERYDSLEELKTKLWELEENIQCLVSSTDIPFGKAQHPELWDYADGVDTMEFLSSL